MLSSISTSVPIVENLSHTSQDSLLNIKAWGRCSIFHTCAPASLFSNDGFSFSVGLSTVYLCSLSISVPYFVLAPSGRITLHIDFGVVSIRNAEHTATTRLSVCGTLKSDGILLHCRSQRETGCISCFIIDIQYCAQRISFKTLLSRKMIMVSLGIAFYFKLSIYIPPTLLWTVHQHTHPSKHHHWTTVYTQHLNQDPFSPSNMHISLVPNLRVKQNMREALRVDETNSPAKRRPLY